MTMNRSLFLLATAVLLAIANPLLHEPVQVLWGKIPGRFGFPTAEKIALYGFGAIVAMFVALAWARWRERGSRKLLALAIGVAASAGSYPLLMVAAVELVHFPQYALFAAVVILGGLSLPAAFLLTTLAGAFDELWQYFVLYAGRADVYLDYNDMLLNAIGAFWGVLMFARTARRSEQTSDSRAATAAATIALAAATLAAFLIDPPRTPFFQLALTGRHYHLLRSSEALLGTFVLWIAVVRLVREKHRVVPPAAAAVFLFILAIGSCARQSLPVVRTWNVGTPFIIAAYCGPPLMRFDDRQASLLAAAHFNLVGSPCEIESAAGLYPSALDTAHRHGLRLLVTDARLHPSVVEKPDWQEHLRAAVAEYKTHPATAGYFVLDEPVASQFEATGAIVGALRAADPARLAYVNLLPDYFSPEVLGAPSYEEYVERFIAIVRPQLLSYDHYPFKIEYPRSTLGPEGTKQVVVPELIDRPSFFQNLHTLRHAALRHNLPFLLIIQAMPHGHYRHPTEAELSWQAFHALAFGASGISYFAYWTPVNVIHADRWKFRNGLIADGNPTIQYYRAKRLNQRLLRIANELHGFRSIAVADSHGELAPPPPIGPLTAVERAPVTIGVFENSLGALMMVLVNRDYQHGVSAGLRWARPPEVFDVEDRDWAAIASAEVDLPPGDAVLLRWR